MGPHALKHRMKEFGVEVSLTQSPVFANDSFSFLSCFSTIQLIQVYNVSLALVYILSFLALS